MRIAVIGGGAAGLAAAVAAARRLRALGCAGNVAVLEADDRVGRSILATGNGRCNYSNVGARGACALYRNAGFVGGAFEALDRLAGGEDDPVHRFFDDLGLMHREEAEGRMYPVTGKASTVVDVLRAAAAALGVIEACGRCAVRIDCPREEGGLFHIRFADGSVEHARAVIVAVGGKHAHSRSGKGGADGTAGEGLLPARYALAPARPVLGPLAVRGQATRALDNIRARAEAVLFDAAGEQKACERGEVLFRSYGVSGICVFNLSRLARPGDVLSLDLAPQISRGSLAGVLRRRAGMLEDVLGHAPTAEELLRGMLLSQVARAVLAQAGVDPSSSVADFSVGTVAGAIEGFRFTVEGIGDERQCQVMRGGLDVSCFNAATMESKLDTALFAAGEALDVDAPCGGYNLHWAWASGLLAGEGAARRIAGAPASGVGEATGGTPRNGKGA